MCARVIAATFNIILKSDKRRQKTNICVNYWKTKKKKHIRKKEWLEVLSEEEKIKYCCAKFNATSSKDFFIKSQHKTSTTTKKKLKIHKFSPSLYLVSSLLTVIFIFFAFDLCDIQRKKVVQVIFFNFAFTIYIKYECVWHAIGHIYYLFYANECGLCHIFYLRQLY